MKNIFDKDIYLKLNNDVLMANVDPYEHYMQFGWKENRKTHELFCLSLFGKFIVRDNSQNPLMYALKNKALWNKFVENIKQHQCPICGQFFYLDNLSDTRDRITCYHCKSSGRYQAMAVAIAKKITGGFDALYKCQPNKEIRIIDMTGGGEVI